MRSLARTMIDDSQRRTGPYRIQVRQKGTAVIGDPVRLAIRVVVARNGRPLPFVPVRVQTPDGTLKGDLTRADGRVGLTYPLPSAGVTSIRVAVSKVPETRLRLMNPRRQAASRAAIAGKKRLLRATDVIYVKARPRVVVTTGDKRLVAGAKSKGRVPAGRVGRGVAPQSDGHPPRPVLALRQRTLRRPHHPHRLHARHR